MPVQAKKIVRFGFSAIAVIGLIASSSAWANRQKSSVERFRSSKLHIFNIPSPRADGSRFAYILDPDGYIHHVEVGEYIGNASGRIEAISATEISFVEIRRVKGDYREERKVLLCDEWCRNR